MSQKSLAYINPELLRWAREQCGYSISEATKGDLSPEKLEKAEKGEDKLTFKQFLKLAKRYKRPPAFFYLNNPPEEELLYEFRTLKLKDVKYSPLLREQVLIIKEKRDLAVLHQKYDKDYNYEYINSITTELHPEKAAVKILNILNMDYKKRKKWKTDYDALNAWKNAVGSIGVLVFQISKISIKEMRGFSISEISYPTIGINRKDSPMGRIFTLIHELCHLMLKKGGICRMEEKDEKGSHIEQYCNSVTGAVLVPKEELLKHVRRHSEVWEDKELRKLKKIFWASNEVILRRLLIFNKTNKKFYQKKRKEWSKVRRSEREGGYEKVFEKVLRTHPHNYIEIVLNAVNENVITLHDVSYYLSMSLKHLDNLRQNL